MHKKLLILLTFLVTMLFSACKAPIENSNKNLNNNQIEEIKKENNSKEENIISTEEDAFIVPSKDMDEEDIEQSEESSPISSEELKYDSRFGFLKNIYYENNELFIVLDEAEIFFGEEAVIEALKDGAGYYEDGKFFVPDGYYIRNNYNTLTSYKIKDTATFYLCYHIIDPYSTKGANLVEVSSEEFIDYVKDLYFELSLWIDTENGEGYKVYQQYRP